MKRDAKLMKKREKNMDKLASVLSMLASGDPLPEQCWDHQLTGFQGIPYRTGLVAYVSNF